jgi:hypothetical protein
VPWGASSHPLSQGVRVLSLIVGDKLKGRHTITPAGFFLRVCELLSLYKFALALFCNTLWRNDHVIWTGQAISCLEATMSCLWKCIGLLCRRVTWRQEMMALWSFGLLDFVKFSYHSVRFVDEWHTELTLDRSREAGISHPLFTAH